MTDCEIILAILKDHEWHNIVDIMRDAKPGAVNWAVRSRVSDLGKKGYKIDHRIGKNHCAEYRLDYVSDPQSARQMCLI